MKSLCKLLIIFAMTIGVFANERPDRKIEINDKKNIDITASNAVIVTAKNAPKTVIFAAEELQDFFGKILGEQPPIVHEPNNAKISFIIGLNKWTKEVKLNYKSLVQDAFIIKTQGNRVYIAGLDDPQIDPRRAIAVGGVWKQIHKKGTLFGVYEFLERFAGVRMYFPGELGTIIPKIKQLSIPEIDIYDRPDFVERRFSAFWDGDYFEGENKKTVRRRGLSITTINPIKVLNAYYRLRTDTNRIPCNHGLNYLNYIKRFGKTNPEYFALMNNGKRHNDPSIPHPGQICYSSGAIEEIYQDVKSYLQGEDASVRKIPALNGKGYSWGVSVKDRKYVDIMPQDGFYPCRCEKCQATFKKGDPNYATELVWGKVVEIAKRLKKENVSGYITMMAYPPYRRLPDFEIPDNVIVMVAELGPWGEGNPAKQQIDNNEIKAWSKKTNRKVSIWTYPNKFPGHPDECPGIPQMTPRAFGKYYQDVSPWVSVAYAESESDRFMYNYLNYYIFSKIAWDNSADYNKILDEHYKLMFGKAANVMQKFYEQIEDIWIKQIGGVSINTSLGPISSPPSNYEIWNNIYNAKVLEQLSNYIKEAEKLTADNPLENKRVKLIKKEFLDNLKNEAKKYFAQNAAVDGLRFYITDKPSKPIYLSSFYKENKEIVDTLVYAWITKDKLYIKFDCKEPNMDNILATKREFDDKNTWKDNSVEIFLNPSNDKKNYYHIIINSEGSITDTKCVKIGTASEKDIKWNSNSEVKVIKNPKSWNVEIAIPLKSISNPNKELFPVNFGRSRILNNGKKNYEKLYTWSPFIRNFHDLENFGSISNKTNLIKDANFNVDVHNVRFLGKWIGKNGSKNEYMLDNKVFFSAPKSIKINLKSKSSFVVQEIHGLKPNTNYKLSYYIKLQDVKSKGKYGGACTNLFDGKNNFFPYNRLTGSNDWVYQGFKFKTTEKAIPKAYLQLVLKNATGIVWFDNVILEEI